MSSLEYHRAGTCPGRDGPRDPTSKLEKPIQSAIASRPVDRGGETSELVSAETGSEDPREAGRHLHWDGITLGPGRPGARHDPDRIGPGGFDGPAAPR